MDVDFHVEHTSSDEYLIIILYIIPADNFLYRKIIWHYFREGKVFYTRLWYRCMDFSLFSLTLTSTGFHSLVFKAS